MTAYPDGPQRASHFIDVLIETAVGQWDASRSQNRWRVGNSFRVMFQDVRQARKRNGMSQDCGTLVQHGCLSTQVGSRPRLLETEDFGKLDTNSTSPKLAMSASPCLSQNPMSISRYIVIAVVRFPRASSD